MKLEKTNQQTSNDLSEMFVEHLNDDFGRLVEEVCKGEMISNHAIQTMDFAGGTKAIFVHLKDKRIITIQISVEK
jgi:hypothetical protein